MFGKRYLTVFTFLLLAIVLLGCRFAVPDQSGGESLLLANPINQPASSRPTPTSWATSPALPLPASPTPQPTATATPAWEDLEPADSGLYQCCAGNISALYAIDPELRDNYIASDEINNRPPKDGNPRYYGMHLYIDQQAGYGLWLPSDWHQTNMGNGHQGVIFSPYPDDLYTAFTAEKYILPISITQADLPALQEGFEACILGLPGATIQSITYTPTSILNTLEARYTYLDGDVRRERWVREIYWNEALLVLTAQGATEGEFEYWLPMFYNTMVTFEI